jgi:hypothetical protein
MPHVTYNLPVICGRVTETGDLTKPFNILARQQFEIIETVRANKKHNMTFNILSTSTQFKIVLLCYEIHKFHYHTYVGVY